MADFTLKSMTGFGRAEKETPLGRLGVELKSVNARFLEISISLPRELSALEGSLRNFLKSQIERGKVDCRVKFQPATGQARPVALNEALVGEYLERLRAIQSRMGLAGEITLQTLLVLPGVIAPPEDATDAEAYWPGLAETVAEAVARFNEERIREGNALARHLAEELALLRDAREKVLAGKDQALARYREKLSARIAELEEQTRGKLEPGRLELEVALYADRSDVSEELVRLESHLNRLEKLITAPAEKSVGKALDFLLQEILRETNTLAAKVRDLELANATLAMKGSIERIREQIQNIE